MNFPDTPPADPAYSFLRVGSLIKNGTEVWDADEQKWVLASATVGLKVDSESAGYYRRAKK